jgi:fumarate hydratase subunit alpha
MKIIQPQQISDAVKRLFIKANRELPEANVRALKSALQRETNARARGILELCLKNLELADPLPICQDTGMAAVFCEWGGQCILERGSLQVAVDEGVKKACSEGFLRPSIVADPFRRTNSGDNTPALLHMTVSEGNAVKLTIAPKGFGSENMSGLHMFTPSATADDVAEFVIEAVKKAGSNPCPPVIVGVGIGANAEGAMLLAKQALLLPSDENSGDEFYAALERRLLGEINALGIGPQGLGGATTALGVRVLAAPTHIAGLPVAVAIGCWVTRHASGVI